MAKLLQYLADTKQEMKRVSWPARGQLWESTVVVIVSVSIMTVILFVADKILDEAVKAIVTIG